MLYYLYEMNHAAVAPWRAAADAAQLFWKNPVNPFAQTYVGRSMAASLDLFERVTRRYGKPAFGITATTVDGVTVAVTEERILHKTFCSLLHFSKRWPAESAPGKQPKLLIVAPMSGHYATLLRGTVAAMLPHADVYITDWVDARQVAATPRQLRSRRLYRLRHRDARALGSRCPCDGRLPALGAGTRRRIADGQARPCASSRDR